MAITINGSGTIGGITAGGLPDACVTAADLAVGAARTNFGAGAVLQAVTFVTNANFSTASSAPVNTQLVATITPVSSASRILVLVHHADAGKAENAVNGSVRLIRNGTLCFDPSYSIGRSDNTTTNFSGGFDFHYIDSPSTTLPLTYRTQAWTSENTNRFYLGLMSAQHSMTLLEIAG